MDAATKKELNAIKAELSSIIAELEDISGGIRKDFAGIGQNVCADVLKRSISNLKTGKKKLDKIDETKVADQSK